MQLVQQYVDATYPFEILVGNHEEQPSGPNGFIDNFAGCCCLTAWAQRASMPINIILTIQLMPHSPALSSSTLTSTAVQQDNSTGGDTRKLRLAQGPYRRGENSKPVDNRRHAELPHHRCKSPVRSAPTS